MPGFRVFVTRSARAGRIVAGLFVSFVCIWLIVRRIDIREAVQALSSFSWPFSIAAIVSLAIGYSVRIERWALLLRQTGASATGRDCRAAFLASVALNNVLPFRAGDIVRAAVFPRSMGISRTAATASLVVERLLDLMMLLTLLALASLFVDLSMLPQWIGHSLAIVAVASVMAAATILLFGPSIARALSLRDPRSNRGLLGASLSVASRLLGDVLAMFRPPALVAASGLTLPIWLAEASLFYFVLQGFSINATFAAALLAMSMSTMATLVPSSPGYVGPFHLAAVAAAEVAGASAGEAAAFAVVSHLALWLPTTFAGAVSLIIHPELLSKRGEPSPVESRNT